MRQKIFKFITISATVYAVLSIIYLALPPEIKFHLPDLNQYVIGVTGGSSGLISLILLNVRQRINTSEGLLITQQTEVLKEFITIKENYKRLESKVEDTLKKTQQYIEKIENLTYKVNSLTKLIEVQLETKLSNVLIDEKTKELIEGVLNEKEETDI